MKSILRAIAILFVLAAAVLSWFLYKHTQFRSDGMTVSITEEYIKGRLAKEFPKHEKILDVIPVVIEKPEVEFVEGTNRVRLSIAAGIDIPFAKKYEASTIFTGAVRYEPSDKTLRLTDVVFEKFKATDVPEKLEEPLEVLMTVLARTHLDDYEVYKVEPKDLTNKAAHWLLKKVEVRNEVLEVTLGL